MSKVGRYGTQKEDGKTIYLTEPMMESGHWNMLPAGNEAATGEVVQVSLRVAEALMWLTGLGISSSRATPRLPSARAIGAGLECKPSCQPSSGGPEMPYLWLSDVLLQHQYSIFTRFKPGFEWRSSSKRELYPAAHSCWAETLKPSRPH